jgi:hypothetical protein
MEGGKTGGDMSGRYSAQVSAMYQFVGKRNEKNGIVCAYCLHPETQEGPCTWFCQSYCQRSFHDHCKDALFPD